ncbi:hypothetical protein JVT61DRAFT_13105 [Boletus reticuloceps]|uniref:Uncharacterized protein n=1 Tax=Boletus reticuloceps TaxID=495285 RepID=A0A8I2YVD8_9AGAM|nr:hypothetical protein JVT61DRAFT_13105 [Boletus reticuloceps]
MRAPALRKLLLRCSPGDEHVSAGPPLRRFLESSTHIKLLELHDVDLPREELVLCFTLLPRLEELRLHDSDISDEELRLLFGPAGLCPNLVRLDVRWCVHRQEPSTSRGGDGEIRASGGGSYYKLSTSEGTRCFRSRRIYDV